jgi:hypothetical protein
MATKWLQVGFASVVILAVGCARKQAQAPPPAPAPPQPKQNVIVLHQTRRANPAASR